MSYLIHFSDGSDAYLAHHGVLGQKWGRRRYQNPDGSYKSGAEGRYDPEPSDRKPKSLSKIQPTGQPKRGLSTKQKVAIGVGVGVAAAVVGTVAVSKLGQSSLQKRILQQGQSYAKKLESGLMKEAASTYYKESERSTQMRKESQRFLNKVFGDPKNKSGQAHGLELAAYDKYEQARRDARYKSGNEVERSINQAKRVSMVDGLNYARDAVSGRAKGKMYYKPLDKSAVANKPANKEKIKWKHPE